MLPLLEAVELETAGYGIDINKADAAAHVGCTVEFPADNELQLDLDTPEAVTLFEERWAWLTGMVGDLLNGYEYRTSRSGNTHCIVTLHEKVSDMERLLWQALLGSDPKREALGAVRLFKLGESRSCLFRPVQQ